MSSETSLLNNSASPVLGYDLEVALNKLKKELDLTEIKNRISELTDLVNDLASRVANLEVNVNILSESLNGLDNRVSNFGENINKLTESLNALDNRVKALEGGS